MKQGPVKRDVGSDLVSEILGSRGSKSEDGSLLGCSAV
jgi:hypothetical protein